MSPIVPSRFVPEALFKARSQPRVGQRWPALAAALGALAVAGVLGGGQAQGAPVATTDPADFLTATTIDFEAGGSGSSASAINTFLAGTGATFSLLGPATITTPESAGTGASDDVRGVATSGSLGVAAADGTRQGARLDFAIPVGAVGAFWGGVETPAELEVDFTDGSSLTFFVNQHLLTPAAGSAPTLNGFLGVDGAGLRITAVTLTAESDLYAIDDLTFGETAASAVPEPGCLALLGLLLAALALGHHTTPTLARERVPIPG